MTDNILDKLLTVRILRTDKAQRKMMLRKANLENMRHRQHRRDQELASYRAWRPREERRLLEDLKQKPRQPHRLMHFKETVRLLRDQEATREQAASEAARQVAEAAAELEIARREYTTAYRKQVKIETCQQTWMDERRLTVEREAEKETEGCVRPPSNLDSNLDSNPARSF